MKKLYFQGLFTEHTHPWPHYLDYFSLTYIKDAREQTRTGAYFNVVFNLVSPQDINQQLFLIN